jgi:hypothetical protein
MSMKFKLERIRFRKKIKNEMICFILFTFCYQLATNQFKKSDSLALESIFLTLFSNLYFWTNINQFKCDYILRLQFKS